MARGKRLKEIIRPNNPKFSVEVDEISNGYVISDYSKDKMVKVFASTFDEMLEILTKLGHKKYDTKN